ncbi:hypothetical protein AWZ03_001917 [Drosophila navojoa]|uniref:Uncharacterized protein n=1 Tax=Drosophila navojoa TaxID=7232 RepID=A0A484BSU8_DRONA|nr:hypothetical protein AWZ03_001917 [Drosophila navojoa]
MLSTKRTELFIGLLAMGVAMLTSSFANNYEAAEIHRYLMMMQFAATCVLLFGVLKAHQQHKDKCMLFWLLTTACLFFGLIFYGISRWQIAVLYMLIIMYNHYVAVTLGPLEAVAVAAPRQTEPTKEQLAKLNGQV